MAEESKTLERKPDAELADVLATLSPGSASLRKLSGELYELVGFWFFVIFNAVRVDYVAHTARLTLDGGSPASWPSEREFLDSDARKVAVERLRKHRRLFLQLVTCRGVDTLTTYLADVLRECLSRRPELLRSRAQVRLDYVLSFDSLDSLLRDQIERQVLTLSYQGFEDLAAWWRDRAGISLCSEDVLPIVVDALETRNLIVHNGGMVGHRYQERVCDSRFEVGKERVISMEDFFRFLTTIATVARDLDRAVSEKFELEAHEFGSANHGEQHSDVPIEG